MLTGRALPSLPALGSFVRAGLGKSRVGRMDSRRQAALQGDPQGDPQTALTSITAQERGRKRQQRNGGAAGGGAMMVGLALATLSQQAADDVQVDASLDFGPGNDVLDLVDRLSDWDRIEEANKALSTFMDTRYPEVLWRQGRIQYLLAEKMKTASDCRAAYDRLVREAYSNLQEAIQQDPSCGKAYLWRSVLLHACAELDGTMSTLHAVDNIREDMERAVTLLPGDGLSRTMLGMWFFQTSQLNWLERQVVMAAGQHVPHPEEGLQKALHWFLETERLRPGESNLNQLMICKTYVALKLPARGRPFLEGAVSAAPRTHSDLKARLEAEEMLQHWKD